MSKILCRTVAGLCILIGSALIPAHANAQQAMEFNIVSQPLSDALRELGTVSNTNIIFEPAMVSGIVAPALKGNITPNEALTRLLAGTRWSFKFVDENTVSLIPDDSKGAGAPASSNTLPESQRGEDGRLRLGQADISPVSSTEPPQSSASEEADKSKVEEIIVTAQKREERLQDVPVPVTAIRADALVDSNQMRLQDYYTKLPGLNLVMMGDVGIPQISIRGITTGGFTNPTAGIVVDDIPFGSSTTGGLGSGSMASDFDPSELSRIEVLRGPQGTLYGASSIGGLIKYVTVDPSTERFRGQLQVGTTAVSRSDELGYSVRGSANVPLSDTLAVRASASTRRDPGYIDNVQTGTDDVNNTDTNTARLAALWRPSDEFSLKLSALYQRAERDGASDSHFPPPVGPVPGLQDMQQSALINSGSYDRKFEAYSAIITTRLGRTDLTSLSGYSLFKATSSLDVSPLVGGVALNGIPGTGFDGFGVTGVVQNSYAKTSKFTQELRLSIPIGERIDWLLGGFYTRESYPSPQDILAIDSNTGAVAAVWLHSAISGSYAEYAAFTDFTFRITDRFDIQVGARQSHNTITSASTNTSFAPPFPSSVTPKFESEEDAFTYLITPRWKISPDLMVYARLASGYRPGGPNVFPLGTVVSVPTEYGHDTTQNYELGAKGSIFDEVLSFDASLYYIDWKDVQLQLSDQLPSGAFQQYTLNAGGAKSQGVELALELRPLEGLTISTWGAYNDAELTDVPANSILTARAGDRLPYSARRSGSFSIDHEFSLWSRTSGFAGASISYVGERKGKFNSGAGQGTFPGYTQMDLRAGARFDSWVINTFINNVTDKRGVLRSGVDVLLPYAVTYTQPRTFGVNLSREF